MVPVHCISRSQELTIDFLTKNLKNLLVRNHWTNFNIILQKCFFGHPLLRLFKPFGFVRKHGRQEAGLIFLINLFRKLQKSSYQKPLDWFQYNFAEMFLWSSSTKIIQAIWIHQKTRPPGGVAYFPYIRGMFEMNCLLSSSSISTWGTIKTNTYLYRAIQYLHNGV